MEGIWLIKVHFCIGKIEFHFTLKKRNYFLANPINQTGDNVLLIKMCRPFVERKKLVIEFILPASRFAKMACVHHHCTARCEIILIDDDAPLSVTKWMCSGALEVIRHRRMNFSCLSPTCSFWPPSGIMGDIYGYNYERRPRRPQMQI